MSLGHENRNADALHKNTFVQNDLQKEINQKLNGNPKSRATCNGKLKTTAYLATTSLKTTGLIKDLTVTERKTIQRKATHKKLASSREKENNVCGSSSLRPWQKEINFLT